jgi:hypothetical protein
MRKEVGRKGRGVVRGVAVEVEAITSLKGLLCR